MASFILLLCVGIPNTFVPLLLFQWHFMVKCQAAIWVACDWIRFILLQNIQISIRLVSYRRFFRISMFRWFFSMTRGRLIAGTLIIHAKSKVSSHTLLLWLGWFRFICKDDMYNSRSPKREPFGAMLSCLANYCEDLGNRKFEWCSSNHKRKQFKVNKISGHF